MNALAPYTPILTLVACIIFALVGQFRTWRSASKRFPLWKKVEAAPTQQFDGTILACLCVPVLFVLTTTEDAGALQYNGGWAVAVTACCLILFCGLCSRSVTTPSVCLLFLLSFFLGDWIRNEVRANRRASSEIKRREELSVAFSTSVDIPNAVLWINGKKVGKLPLEMNAAELVQTLPSKAEFERGNERRYERLLKGLDRGYLFGMRRHNQRFVPWSPISIRYGNINDAGRFEASCQIRSNGVGAWQSSHALFSSNGRFVFHDVRFRKWENELTRLAHYARLCDYDVGDDWYQAVCSYQTRGWAFFFDLVSTESELCEKCDQIAARLYSLRDLSSHEAAISAFERIQSMPDAGVGSPAGLRARVIELIAPHLDVEELVPYLMNNIEDVTRQLPANYILLEPPPPPPDKPFGYLVWYLDREWDSEESHSDPNLLEDVISREAISRGNPYGAFRLGGPLAEELLKRKFHEAERRLRGNSLGSKQQYRQALTRLALSEGQMGRWARESRKDEFLLWLDEALRELDDSPSSRAALTHSVPDHLRPLLHSDDNSPTAASLARESWVRILNATEKLESPEHRWEIRSNWLTAMYPNVTPETFAEAWMKTSLLRHDLSLYRLSHRNLHTQILPTDFRFRVLDIIRRKREAELKTLTASASDRLKREAEILKVMRTIALLPCRGGAEAFVELQEQLTKPHHIEMLRDRMSVNLYHDDHVEVLAEHQDVEYRSAALLAVRYHPTPRRRKVLRMLLQDSNDRIQREAQAIASEFARLRESKLPHRTPPSPAVDGNTVPADE